MTIKKSHKVLGWTCYIFSSFFFSGRISYKGAGGGTATSIVVTLLLIAARIYIPEISITTVGISALLSVAIGILAVERAEQFIRLMQWNQTRYNSKGKNVDGDYGQTTIDEVAGMLITVLPIYILEAILHKHFSFEWFLALQILALILFRIYDSIKPNLVKKVEDNLNRQSSITIMLDDVVAAGYALNFMIIAVLSIALFNPQSLI